MSKEAVAALLKANAPYLLIVAAAFLIFEFYLLIASFPGDYHKYQLVANSVAQYGYTFWPVYWLVSEYLGTIGLAVRCVGAVFFFAFAVVLLRKKSFELSYFRTGILLQALQYLLLIPIVAYIFLVPDSSTPYHLAGLSYALQMLLILPTALILYVTLKKPNASSYQLFKWIAVSAIAFMFALWVKHFIFSLYALPITFEDTILLIGSLNSMLTILCGAVLLAVTLLPILRGDAVVNKGYLGASLLFVGAYFVIYLLISSVSHTYLSFLSLTELWVLSFLFLGLAFLTKKSYPAQ